MTSLAKQLQRLAVPSVQATFAEDKKKASLLFDHKEAASIDRETFHDLGLNGLEELASLDQEFHEFESTLYGDSSLTFERSVQTKEVNEKLDETIKRFLIRLSPYCLLKPAHKALEWLIHRFHIHLTNTDELIKCFLPYHESKIFIRVLQLIRFNSKMGSKWDWLEPLQKSGVHLPKTTLINHCMTNPNFLSFVCDMVPDAVKVLTEAGEAVPKCRVLFSFYATTIIGVLENREVSETLLAALLPHLARGLRSPYPEYKAASYMILAQLLHKATLKSEMLKRFQQLLAKSLISDLLGEGMACILLMFQKQDMSKIAITKKSFHHLCRHYTVVDTIIALSEQFDTEYFLSCFLERLIPAAFKHAIGIATSGESSDSDASAVGHQYMPLLHRLLSGIKLPDDLAEQAAYKFLHVFVRHGSKHLDEDVDDRIKDSLQGIVRQLEGKHSKAVDKAVSRMMNESSDDERHLVKEFLNLYVLSVPRQLVTDSETSLVLSLNHRLASVRETAVKTLLKNKNGLDNEEFLKTSLEARLKDEDNTVVQAALAIDKDLWSVMEDDSLTIRLLTNIVLNGFSDDTWYTAASKAVQILGVYKGDHSMDIVASCLPCFCISSSSKDKLGIINSLLSSALAKNNSFLLSISKEWKKISADINKEPDNSSKVNAALAQCVTKGLYSKDAEDRLKIANDWCSDASDHTNMRTTLLMLVVLTEMIAMETDETVKQQIALLETRLIVSVFQQKRYNVRVVTKEDMTCSLQEINTWQTTDDQIPGVFCLRALHYVIQAISTPQQLKGKDLWQISNEESQVSLYLKVCVEIIRLLLQESAGSSDKKDIFAWRYLLKQFEQDCFSEEYSYIKFLGLLWSCHLNDQAADLGLTLNLQVRAIKLGLSHLQMMPAEKLKLLVEGPYIAYLLTNILLMLKNSEGPLRKMAVKYVEVLLDGNDNIKTVYHSLMKRLVQCSAELVADSDFINQVLAMFFKSTKLSIKSTTPAKTRGKKKSGLSADESVSEGDATPSKDARNECLSSLLTVILDEQCPYYIQRAMLDMWSALNNTDVLTNLLPLMERLLAQDPSTSHSLAPHCLNLLLRRFTTETRECLEPGCSGLKLFLKGLTHHKIKGEESPQMVALQQITKQLFTELPDSSQHQLLTAMFDVCVETDQLKVANQVRKVLKHLSVNGDHIQEELKKCLKVTTAKTVREAKRQRRSMPAVVEADEFDSATWQRVTIVLETMQMKKKLQNYTVLVPVCFQIIAVILESSNHQSAEYIKQLLLTLLYTICTRLEQDDDQVVQVPEEQFNMELIVQCIRSSDNPQTHHQSLLLLTSAAKIYPERLLQNMMSVFTFMGANIMRQDDAYSFLIIGKILETVIPALITACNQRTSVPKGITNDQVDIITMVIQVFVDSYQYIPEHRRHLLFNKLLTVIGENQYLWRTQLLMMVLVVTKGNLKAELASDGQEATESLGSDMEFCLTLSADFSPAVQLSSARQMILYLSKLPDEKQEDDKPVKRPVPQSFGKLKKADAQLFNVELHTGKQLRHFKYAVIHLLTTLFSSNHFISQVSENEDEDMMKQFQALLESVLQFVSHVTMVTNKSADKSAAKYWKALQHKVHDLLDKLVSLLPNGLFLEAIGGLVSHDLPTIQRKAMELLSAKLQQQKDMSEEEVESLLPLVKQLLDLVQRQTHGRNISDENSVNCQTAFICLKLLCRNIGLQHPALFTQVLKTAVDVFKNRHVSLQVSSCALLCMTETCSTLKVHIIPHLSTFMPSLLHVMKDTEVLLQHDLYLMSVVTTVNKVVENLSNFLSPYLLDIITCVCVLSSQEDEVVQKPQVQLRLKTIKTTISTSLPTRVLLPVVTLSYTSLVKVDRSSLGSLISLFGDHISHIGREELTSHLTQLQSFFLQCLDIRVDQPEATKEEITLLEGVTIETIITMVMKLSESTFKPFLYKIFDWATSMDDLKERVLVFYRFAERLAERLRSLFTLFAGHIIGHSANMLDSNNTSKHEDKFFPQDKSKRTRSCQLLVYVLDTVYKCCLYDTEGFITKERFDQLSQSLIDQLDNMVGGEEEYEKRTTSHLVPCIVQLALAAQDDSLWKTLNYQVCLKTRSQEPEVKIGALQVLDTLHKKLGDDYMPLLPETVPFLAELMEDESDDVEKKCQEVIREMEKTLGEPLQKYF